MANVAHKNLTGADIHEPKGADNANANEVYRADGTGTGSWSKLDHNSLTTTGNPFGAQLLHVREQTADTGSGTTVIGNAVWHVRVLNTSMTNEIAGASLGSNTVSLPAGTYHVKASAPFRAQGTSVFHRLRIRNTSSNTTLVAGTNTYIINGTGGNVAHVEGRFTLSGATNIQLHHFIAGTTGGQGFGDANGLDGESDVYSELFIWKIA